MPRTSRPSAPLAAGLAAVLVLAQPIAALAQTVPMVTPQPSPDATVAPYVIAPGTSSVDRNALIKALRRKVKYVFVIFNENHSFDNEFGTFPGANGIYADGPHPRDAAHTPGFTQSYKDVDGKTVTVKPIRLGPAQNSTFVDSVDHSHVGLAKKLGMQNGAAIMTGFAADEYERYASKGGPANEAMGRQFAQLVMSYVDCDTIPFMWQWASRFALFDNSFATEDTPSTPNAIAMLAGQAGESQWVRHGVMGGPVTLGSNSGKLQGVPLVNDPQPYYGSQFDNTSTDRQPRGGPRESYKNGNIAQNLTFASTPLLFAGPNVAAAMKQDRAPAVDLRDIQQDIPFLAARNGAPVEWRWYEEGYDHEPTDKPGEASHDGYVSHHNGAQYFGYIADNPAMAKNMRGLGDVFDDIAHDTLPKQGGVFYVRGGFDNIAGLKPPIQNADFPGKLTDADRNVIEKTKQGDDDHPSYSDRQLSETMMARLINAVAGNAELWKQSVILISYDESDGFYDHVKPRILSYGPAGLPMARGIRVPMLLISPYARAHVVSHAEGDHNAVIETIEALFDLPPLATLPDEKQDLMAGTDPQFNGPGGFVQHHLGPRDINTPETDDLLSGFEPGRLMGTVPMLPGSYAMIPDSVVTTLPHFGGKGCQAIGMTPVDQAMHVDASPPAGFNTLPATLPRFSMPAAAQ